MYLLSIIDLGGYIDVFGCVTHMYDGRLHTGSQLAYTGIAKHSASLWIEKGASKDAPNS